MTQSMIAEKNFISKLKAEAGVAYVNKMTSMLSDLDSSKEEMNLYRNSSSKATPSGIPFAVQVLQNAWDIDKTKFEKLILPKTLNNCLDDFNSFYIGRHKNHKLTWALGLVKNNLTSGRPRSSISQIEETIQVQVDPGSVFNPIQFGEEREN